MWVVCHLSRCPFVYNRLRGGCNVKMSHTRLLWPRENRGFSRWNLRWVLRRLWNWTFAVKPHLCDGSPFLRRFCTEWPMLSDELDSKPEVIFTTLPAVSVSFLFFLTVPALTPTLFYFAPPPSCWCSLCRTRPSRWCRVWRTRTPNTPVCPCWLRPRARCAARWSSQVSCSRLQKRPKQKLPLLC